MKIKYRKSFPYADINIDFDIDKDREVPPEKDDVAAEDLSGVRLHKQMESIVRTYINAGESHLFVMPFVSSALFGLISYIMNVELLEFLEGNCNCKEVRGDEFEFDIPYAQLPKITELLGKVTSSHFAQHGYSKSLILQLSTSFDILVAGLVRQIVLMKPSVLEASDRKVDFVDLKKFSNLDELRESFVDKTIETVVRKSQSEQFAWLSEKLDMKLTKNLNGWCDFIEINERRNLFTHTEGLVTKEYIENCVSAGCVRDTLSGLGETLSADDNYVKRSSELFFVIGVKLAQVVWRKLSEDYGDGSLQSADRSIIVLTFDLNRSRNVDVSAELGKFACGDVIKRHFNDRNRRTLYINYAAALMLQDKTSKAVAILDELEWDAVSQDFGLAVASIKGDLDHVCKLMPKP